MIKPNKNIKKCKTNMKRLVNFLCTDLSYYARQRMTAMDRLVNVVKQLLVE